MSTFSDKMTAINNEIRTMTNTTAEMGLDTMKNHLADANDDIDTEAGLIEQLMNALTGKSIDSNNRMCYIGSALPDSSFGNDGDIYIMKG